MVASVHGPGGVQMHVPGPPVQFGLSGRQYSRTVPALGADTAAVLAEYGYSASQIDELATADVIGRQA
jgi:crotonobetainyl-CoA:carnitine CoA-transferase CaiB-like acyl-CoA transferase